MLEGWTDDSAPGIGPMGNPLRPGVLDLQARSWADYGPKEGAWRLLDILAAAEVRAVWYTNAIVAERHPALIAAIAEAGHTLAAHGWAQNILPAYQDEASEAADLERSLRVLGDAAGAPPRGWLSPRCTPSAATSALLAASGLAWHADIFDSDLPYRMETLSGSLIAMPFTMEVNDMPLYVRHGAEPAQFSRILERIVGHWPDIGNRPGCLDITVHAHVFGRPYGLVELRHALAIVRRHDWAWLTDHDRLAMLMAA
jgi:peptidoglycan/xylan/chitin deacetylase (PgdA/CDA1 family)